LERVATGLDSPKRQPQSLKQASPPVVLNGVAFSPHNELILLPLSQIMYSTLNVDIRPGEGLGIFDIGASN
jgi:hypothetical protein